MDNSRWYLKFLNRVNLVKAKHSLMREPLEKGQISCKERRGRFLITWYGLTEEEQEYLKSVEQESVECCQHCGRHTKQYDWTRWWYRHYCFPCYCL